MTGSKSRFIVFEGIDGSGKSTQIKRLQDHMISAGIPVSVTREPTDNDIGLLLRSYLKKEKQTGNEAIAALFAADRLDHITRPNGILETLKNGTSLLCDRYYLSSYAYHSVDCDLDWVIDSNRIARQLARPDLHIFLDLPAEVSMERVTRRGETELFEQLERQQSIRENFFTIFEKLKDEENVLIVDGTKNQNIIAEEIWDKVKYMF